MSRDYSHDFHDFGGAVYVNCAFHGAMPRRATAAVEEALALKRTPHLIRDEHHFSFPDAYRQAIAELIEADPNDIAVTNSATHGTMILVSGLDWQVGDEVIIPADEFPSNRFPWRSLEERGVVIRELELTSPDQATEAIEQALNERTRVVSLSWVGYSSGLRIDLVAIGELCRANGALFAIDASQGIGGLEFSVGEAHLDLVTCAGYKWMLGPYGVGFAWIKPGLADHLRVVNINWFSLAGARDFNRLSECDLSFEPGARRFDVNEPGNFFNMAGATASTQYLIDVGVDRAQEHIQGLHRRLVDGLPAGMHPRAKPTQRLRSPILCIATESERAGDEAFERLTEARIFLSRREGSLRVSPHLFNTEADIDRLLEVLASRKPTRTLQQPPRGSRLDESEPASMPTPDLLEGRFIKLRPIDPARDAAGLFPGSHQEETVDAQWAYMSYGPFDSSLAMQEYLQECAESESQHFLAVEHLVSGRVAGIVCFQRAHPEMRTLELAHIWYLPEFQRTEVNTEAIYLLLRESFDRLGYRRVEWKCDSLNAPSRRAALRLGFGFEGIFPQHMIVKGRNRDTAWFAVLDRDWPRIRANMEAWLAADAGERPSLGELNRR